MYRVLLVNTNLLNGQRYDPYTLCLWRQSSWSITCRILTHRRPFGRIVYLVGNSAKVDKLKRELRWDCMPSIQFTLHYMIGTIHYTHLDPPLLWVSIHIYHRYSAKGQNQNVAFFKLNGEKCSITKLLILKIIFKCLYTSNRRIFRHSSVSLFIHKIDKSKFIFFCKNIKIFQNETKICKTLNLNLRFLEFPQ